MKPFGYDTRFEQRINKKERNKYLKNENACETLWGIPTANISSSMRTIKDLNWSQELTIDNLGSWTYGAKTMNAWLIRLFLPIKLRLLLNKWRRMHNLTAVYDGLLVLPKVTVSILDKFMDDELIDMAWDMHYG